MNGTCAGGTGAFIDQMATLLQTDPTAGLNDLASAYKKLYPIASRCGVFAKSDLQPLLNQGGARRSRGFHLLSGCDTDHRGFGLGGRFAARSSSSVARSTSCPSFALPMSACFPAQTSFVTPDNAQLYVAMGAALSAENAATEPVAQKLVTLIDRLTTAHVVAESTRR
jgi:activator of 2-hydroxyglutaryl-CoA dehydratase